MSYDYELLIDWTDRSDLSMSIGQNITPSCHADEGRNAAAEVMNERQRHDRRMTAPLSPLLRCRWSGIT